MLTEQQWFAEAQDVIFNIDHQLKGEYQDSKTGEWLTIEGVGPMINDKGRLAIITLLRAYVNKFQLVSDFSDDRIKWDLYALQKELAKLLAINWKEYEVSNRYHTCLVRMVVSLAGAVMYSAKDGRFGNKILAPAQVVQSVRPEGQMPIGRSD